MIFLSDVLKGKAGLAITFWLGGVLGHMTLIFGVEYVNVFAIRNSEYPLFPQLILYGYSMLTLAYSVFICTAVYRAAAFNRKPGVWGWIGRVIAALGTLIFLYLVSGRFATEPYTWNELEQEIRIVNEALPLEIDEVMTLTRKSLSRETGNLIFHVNVNFEFLEKPHFDLTMARISLLEDCSKFKQILGSTIKAVEIDYTSNNGSTAKVQITDDDCGF